MILMCVEVLSVGKVAPDGIEGFDDIKLPDGKFSSCLKFHASNSQMYCLSGGVYHLNDEEYCGYGIALFNGEKYAIMDIAKDRINICKLDRTDEQSLKYISSKIRSELVCFNKEFKSDTITNFEEFLNTLRIFCSKKFAEEMKGLVKMNYDFKFSKGMLLKAKVPIVYRNDNVYAPGTVFEVVKVVDYSKTLSFEFHNDIFNKVGCDKGVQLKVRGKDNNTFDIQVDCAVVYALFDLYDAFSKNTITINSDGHIIKKMNMEI